MATSASHGQAKESPSDGVELLVDHVHLQLDRIGFGQKLWTQSEKTRCDLQPVRFLQGLSFGQKISCNLLDDETVELRPS